MLHRLLRLLLVVWLIGAATLGWAQSADVQPVPPLSDRVVDQAALLTPAQRSAMTDKLAQFEQQTGAQVVVLTVPTTAPEDIASYAQRVGDAWKIGRHDVGDGLLLVVAKNDRTVFIATTKALEGAVPDLAAHQIIDERIVPAFKQGDFAGGLNAGLDALMARIRGENLPAPQRQAGRAAGGGIDIGQLMMFFFIGVPVVGGVLTAILGRKLGSLATAGGAGALAWLLGAGAVLAVIAAGVALVLVGVLGVGSRGRGMGGGMPIIWGGGGGGFGGGGGGGGFSSGGGGDFGGGGASGRW